jgi:restriction endonuclease Mrr
MAGNETKAGMGVDSKGNPVIDPTANVLQLVEAAVKRINDLHDQEIAYNEKIRVGDLKNINDKIETSIKRIDDIRDMQVKKLEDNLNEHKAFNKSFNQETKENLDDKLKSQKILSDAILTERDAKLTDKFAGLAMAIDKAFEAQKTLSDAILTERDAKLADKFASLATAINKAEIATEKRFDSVNEFRAQLADQQKTFLTTNEYRLAHQNLQDVVSTNAKNLGDLSSSQNKTLSDIILVQKERIDKIDNKKEGGTAMWILIVGVVGFLTGMISFILNILGK